MGLVIGQSYCVRLMLICDINSLWLRVQDIAIDSRHFRHFVPANLKTFGLVKNDNAVRICKSLPSLQHSVIRVTLDFYLDIRDWLQCHSVYFADEQCTLWSILIGYLNDRLVIG